MSDDPLDRELHDFLDGRLSVEERANFEARLKAEPALAARVRSHRAIGEALRSGAPELPPGFYTRARARFEATATPPARRRFRFVSWEAAGLATAAVVAVAIFLPAWLERDGTLDRTLIAPSAHEEQATPAAPLRDAAAETDDSGASGPAGPAAVGQSATDIDLHERSADATATQGQAGVEEPAGGAKPGKTPTDAGNEPGLRKQAAVAELAAPSAAPQHVPPPEPPPAAATRSDGAVVASPEQGLRQPALDEGYLSEKAEPFTAIPLDDGRVEPGSVQLVDAVGESSEQEDAREGEFSAAETKQERRERQKRSNVAVRWLLIGPRDAPFSCRGIRFTAEGEAWVVGLAPPAADRPAAEFGCAVALPRDGRAVRVTGP